MGKILSTLSLHPSISHTGVIPVAFRNSHPNLLLKILRMKVLKNCHVVDVVNGVVVPNQFIWIDDAGVIRKMGGIHAYQLDQEMNKQVDKVTYASFEGSYVMPGLIDCHVHVTAFTGNFALLERTLPSYVTARAIETLHHFLCSGFTTLRDAGGADAGLAQAIQEGYVTGPRLLVSGKALSQTGGHGDMRLPGEFAKAQQYCGCGAAGLGVVCDGDAQVRQAVRDQVRTGVHQIKVMAGGGVTSPTDRITSTQFSMQELRAIVEEAHAANLYVLAHAYTPRAIVRAVHAGVRSIEHGNLLDEESAAVMAEAGTVLVPTLLTYERLKRDGIHQGLTPDMVAKVDDVLEAGKRSVGLAHRHGIKMAFGTDCLADMRQNPLEEFRLLMESGLPADEILRTATCHAADLVGQTGKLGVVETGAYADLLLLKRNPLQDLLGVFCSDNWENECLGILKSGQLVDRSSG